MTILDAALDYRRRGCCVIPLGANKKPAVRWKRYQTHRPDDALIRKWFNSPRPGVAVIFGEVSGGLASRDFDEMAVYERWALDYPQLAATLPTVETRRGRHVYCTVDVDCERRFREALGKPNGRGAVTCLGGELRIGVGCYSVVPPSRHPEGHIYRWLLNVEHFPRVDLFDSGFTPCNREEQRVPKTVSDEGDVGGDGSMLNDEPLIDDDAPTTPIVPCLEYSLDSPDSLLHEQVALAIQRTLPTKTGRRHKQVFELCRELQAIPQFRGQSPKALRPVVREWHRRALPNIQTKPFDETWLDFAESWGRVKHPKGEEPIAMIFAKAAAMEPPPEALQFESPQVRELVGLCRELQVMAGRGPFYLSTRAAGGLLHVSHVNVSRWLRLLCLENVLREVSKGSVESGQASRYRYLGQISPSMDNT